MYYSKRNKPDTERQILYALPYMWDLKYIILREAERRIVVARGLWKMRLSGQRVQGFIKAR